MNTLGGTIGTAAPQPKRRRRALPAATGHRQWKGTIPAGGPSKNRRSTATDMRSNTAAHTLHRPRGGHPLMERQRGTPGTASPHQGPRRWASNQRLKGEP